MRSYLHKAFAVDLRSLALFRILLGATILLDLLLRLQDFNFFYTDYGVLPAGAIVQTSSTARDGLCLYYMFSFRWWPYVLFALTAGCAGALMVGWRVALTCPALWLLTVSLQARAPLALNSSDRLLVVYLLFGCFLPWDRIWARGKPRRLEAEEYRVYHPAAAGIMAQMLIMYWAAASYKYGPIWLQEGSALYRALLADSFARSTYLLSYPELCRYLSWGALALEVVGPLLLLVPHPRVRTATLAALAAFHLGSGALLDIGLFPVVCILGLLSQLPSAVWSRQTPGTLRVQGSAAERYVVAGALILILGGNLGARLAPESYPKSPLRRMCSLFGLDQNWALFAPSPPLLDFWYVAMAQYKDGSRRNLLHPELPEGRFFDRPSLREGSHRRRQLFLTLEFSGNLPLRKWVAYYYYRLANRQTGANKAARVNLFIVRQENRLDHSDAPAQAELLATWPPEGANSTDPPMNR